MIDEEDMMAASEIYDSQQFLNLMKETAPPKQELQPIPIERQGTVMVRVEDSDSSSEE